MKIAYADKICKTDRLKEFCYIIEHYIHYLMAIVRMTIVKDNAVVIDFYIQSEIKESKITELSYQYCATLGSISQDIEGIRFKGASSFEEIQYKRLLGVLISIKLISYIYKQWLIDHPNYLIKYRIIRKSMIREMIKFEKQ